MLPDQTACPGRAKCGERKGEMPLIRGKVVLILGFVFLTTFLTAVRGLPVRGKQRGSSPKERSSRLAEVGRSIFGEIRRAGRVLGELFSAPAPPLVPGQAGGGSGPRAVSGLSGASCASRREQHPSHTCPAARPPRPRERRQRGGAGPPHSYRLFPRSLSDRALSWPAGSSGSLRSPHWTEAEGKGML